MFYDATELLKRIRQKAGIPDDHPDYTDAVLLRMATEKILLEIAALMRSAQEALMEVDPGADTDQALVTDQRAYDIPYRAEASSITRVAILRRDGVNEDALDRLSSDSASGRRGYFIRNAKIVLTYDPTADGSKLRVYHERRPNRLVTVASTRTVTANTGGVLTISSAPPAAWTTATKFDFIRPTTPFFWRAIDVTASVVGPTATMTVPAATGVVVGDYVSLAEESCVPNVPAEFHDLLARLTANSVLMEIGPADSLESGEAEAEVLGETALRAIQPRASQQPKRISARMWMGR